MLRLLLPILLCFSCSDAPPTTPETRPVDNPNAGNTAIYDVDPDDPYEIGDGEFLDLRPGAKISGFRQMLKPFELRDGEGTFSAYRIAGRGGEELGYVLPDPLDSTLMREVTITSPDVVTLQGIRVGNSYDELVERIGAVEKVTTEIESRVYATKDKLSYRLQDDRIIEITIRR